MRLIDADELKKCAIPCEIHNGALTDLCVPLYQIDNAPTVEHTFEEAFQKTVCENRLYCPARPHGEWQEPFESNGKTYHKCTHCHISSELILFGNYCPNCGAQMFKEGNR